MDWIYPVSSAWSIIIIEGTFTDEGKKAALERDGKEHLS